MPDSHSTLLRLAMMLVAALACVVLTHNRAGAMEPPAAVTGCITCHGEKGMSQLPNAPHIAGQPVFYLVDQLKAYRSGKRQNQVMAVIAKPLSDEQIKEAAAWYASHEIQLKATD